ncbi:hypothetical protein E8K88_07115 [Lampropedia aestuarii]|uniref:Surface antigen domain-containing protein n=1 Tax=Lampropedia aestuarii TaxID=2562762 RepID=A0A4S5BSP1_9BURK|nr:hypothetical protein [Lampropedia aestuarii]THJ34283.1 hypothetical protein E8K88_07115 [Lampropedia aestuarii]
MKYAIAKCLPAAVVCGAAMLIAQPVFAAPLSFLNDTLAASVPRKDVPDLRDVVGRVLNEAADNSPTEWVSQHSPRNRPLHMVLTPLQTVQTKKAGTCRLLNVQAQKQLVEEKVQYWFCQQADGAWKASGSQVH